MNENKQTVLTDEEIRAQIDECSMMAFPLRWINFARAIESAVLSKLRAYALADLQQSGGDVDERAMFEQNVGVNYELTPSTYRSNGYAVPVTQAAWEGWQARAALAAHKPDGGDAALREIKDALVAANETPNGPICDTIWMPGRPETLFDFIDAAISAQQRQEGK